MLIRRVVLVETGGGHRDGTLTWLNAASSRGQQGTRVRLDRDADGRTVVTVESDTLDEAATWRRANEELDRVALERKRRRLVKAIVKLRPAARAVQTARRRGGRTRGERQTEEAMRHDPEIRKHYRRWQQSDELREEFRSPVTFIRSKITLPTYTIQRALRRLNRDSS